MSMEFRKTSSPVDEELMKEISPTIPPVAEKVKAWIGFPIESFIIDSMRTPEEPPAHITFLYLGEDFPAEEFSTIEQIVINFSRIYSKFTITVADNFEIWNRKFIVKPARVPGHIYGARKTISRILDRKGLPYSKKFAHWSPHITITKSTQPAPVYYTNNLVIPCSQIFLFFDGKRYEFELTGELYSTVVS